MYIQEIFLDLETFFISLICPVDFYEVVIDLDTLFVSREQYVYCCIQNVEH